MKRIDFVIATIATKTTRALVSALKLDPQKTTTSFQSRLGRTPWIRPYTDESLLTLARASNKRILVFSPSFTTDGLETLEEIGIRGKESFLAAGGESLELLASLNSEGFWIEAFCEKVRNLLR